MYERKFAQVIDQFIDDLLQEKKPAIYHSEAIEPELEKFFETVRAVKRLRTKKKSSSFFKTRWFKSLLTIAAALALVLGLEILPPAGLNEENIVHAVVKAYDELQSYRGIAEIRSEQKNGEVDFLETIQIQYQKPFRYSAVHLYNGYEMHYLSDGRTLAVIEPGEVTLDYLFPEKELWRYHIGTAIWELEEAAEVKILGQETLFGRRTSVLEYRFAGDSVSHRLWIDESTRLPLRKVLNHPEGNRLIVEFKEIFINPEPDENTFVLNLPEGKKVVELNRSVSLKEANEIWAESAKTLEHVPAEMELQRVGILKEDLFALVLRFRGKKENDFMDIYYAASPGEITEPLSPSAETGKLGKGFVELEKNVRNVFKRYIGESNTARWSSDNGVVFIVSSRETQQLQEVLENLAGEKIRFSSSPAAAAEEEAVLYFMEMTETRFKLGTETRKFARQPEAEDLLQELLKGPQKETLQRIIPEGTRLLGIRVEEGIAYIDFSPEITAANYGAEAESVLINSIVYTLTQLEEIEAVQILVEGKIVPTLGGHIFIDKPLP